MPVREVLLYPHPLLKRAADLVEDLAAAAALADDLVETMRSFPRCVGLAAPQVGASVRLCVVDCSEHPRATVHHGLLVLANPLVARAEGAEIAREGCLSIPDLTADVRRATRVRVEATDLEGRPLAIEAEGFEARALQHEIDHLDGLLFLDRVASLTRDVFRRKRYA